MDSRMADSEIKEQSIKTDIRRRLINGLGAGVMSQKGLNKEALEYEDGYNYWYSVEENGKQQNWYIERGKDFRR